MPRASIPDAVEGQTLMSNFRPDEFRDHLWRDVFDMDATVAGDRHRQFRGEVIEEDQRRTRVVFESIPDRFEDAWNPRDVGKVQYPRLPQRTELADCVAIRVALWCSGDLSKRRLRLIAAVEHDNAGRPHPVGDGRLLPRRRTEFAWGPKPFSGFLAPRAIERTVRRHS